MESEEGDITEGEERRGSIPTLSTSRRGSRLQDILRFNQEKKRKRDSQGFTWKRMPTQSFDDIQPYEEPTEEPTPPNVTNAEVSPEQLAAIAAALAATSNVSTEQFIENSINELPYGKRGYQSYIHALPYSTTIIKPEQLAALSHEERSDIHPEHLAALLRGRADNQPENLVTPPRKRSNLQPEHSKAMPHDRVGIELDNLAGLSRGRSDIQPNSPAALLRARSDIQPNNQAALSRARSDIQPNNQAGLSHGRPDIQPNQAALSLERSDIKPENQQALSRGRPDIQPENQAALSRGRSNIQPEIQAAALTHGRSDIKPGNQLDMSRGRSDLQPEPLAVPTFEETGVQLKYLSTLAPGDREGTSHYTQDIRGTRIKTVPIVSPVPPETKISQSKKDSLSMSPSGRVSSPSGRGSNPPQSYIQIEGNGRHSYGLPVGRPIDASPKKSPRKSRLSKTGNGGSGASGYKDGNGASRQRKPRDLDSGSLQSEHSFRTCSEEPEPALVPRAVSDNYEYSTRASLERPGPTSVKTVQQQRYSNALDAVVGTSAGTPGTNRSGGAASSGGGGSPLPYTPSNRTTPASSRAKR